MARHVIVGAGPVGSSTARLLAERGHQVTIVTRSGGGPVAPGVERVAADATNADALARLTEGAATLYNCANPPYNRWPREWPPLAASILTAAERAGAGLVTMSNLYGYGPVDHPMREEDPLAATSVKGRVRAGMWEEALAAHREGRVRATEARAADFFGPAVRESHFGERTVPRLLRGRSARVFGDPDMPHSWTYMPDVAAALVTLGTDDRSWGRPWHVPTSPPMSQRQALGILCAAAGAPAPKIAPLSKLALRAAGVFVPMVRELDEMAYQFDRPFVLDSSQFETVFGARPTSMDEALATTAAWWREQERAAA